MSEITHIRVVRHGHIFCGLGSGAAGFNDGQARVGNMVAKFECVGGIDVDPAGIRDFQRLTGVPGTLMDLFSLDQYMAFHGKPPPKGWKEKLPADISGAFTHRPDILFLSAPCKGFSGLLSETSSQTAKYQALNELTLRGMWLVLEAYQDDPIPLFVFENVPRIATRGRHLLDQITGMLRHYGYAVAETTHDCGELGGLAQSRKRFLLVARHEKKVPPYLYEPPKQRLRGVGEILDKMPLPGDPRAGPMHRIPALQWQTWVRLAFVEAGSDWRSLNKLNVENGMLTDFGIVPQPMRNAALGVVRYDAPAGAIIGESFPTNGRFAVADPRAVGADWNADVLGVRTWKAPTGTVAGRSSPSNGAFSVADPRHEHWGGGQAGVVGWKDHAPTITSQRSPLQGSFSVADPRENAGRHHGAYGVQGYAEPAGVVTAAGRPSHGTFPVADPRINGHEKSVQLGVRPWTQPAATVTGQMMAGQGPFSVSDPRVGQDGPRFSNAYRIVAWESVGCAVTSAKGALAAVADPRPAGRDDYKQTKYRVTAFDEAAGTVIAASTTGNGGFAVADPRGGPDPGALHGKHRVEAWDGPSRAVIAGRENGATAVADPRPTHGPNAHQNKMRVVDYSERSPTVTGSDRVGSGALCVADPRPACLNREGRDSYINQRHYGVTAWTDYTDAVPAFAKNNNGPWSVADPRPVGLNKPGRDTKHVDHYGVLTWTESSGAVIGSAHGWDNGRWSVADPRPVGGEPVVMLPNAKDRLVCVIIALDDTWHRPFTTLELAGLQSFFDPEEAFAFLRDPDAPFTFELDGKSDSAWRERIGNAVPRAAAKAIASTMGRTLLLSEMGETFMLSADAIWVQPLEIALAVDSRRPGFDEILALEDAS